MLHMTSKTSWARMWSISVECVSELRCSGNEHKSEFKYQQTYTCQMRIKNTSPFSWRKRGFIEHWRFLTEFFTSHVNLDSKFVGFFLMTNSISPSLPLCFWQNGSLCLLNTDFVSLKGVRVIVPWIFWNINKKYAWVGIFLQDQISKQSIPCLAVVSKERWKMDIGFDYWRYVEFIVYFGKSAIPLFLQSVQHNL